MMYNYEVKTFFDLKSNLFFSLQETDQIFQMPYSTESTYRSPKSFVILNFFFQKVSFFKGTSHAGECQAKSQRQGEVHVALAVVAIQ